MAGLFLTTEQNYMPRWTRTRHFCLINCDTIIKRLLMMPTFPTLSYKYRLKMVSKPCRYMCKICWNTIEIYQHYHKQKWPNRDTCPSKRVNWICFLKKLNVTDLHTTFKYMFHTSFPKFGFLLSDVKSNIVFK